jgi:hypothetical protein
MSSAFIYLPILLIFLSSLNFKSAGTGEPMVDLATIDDDDALVEDNPSADEKVLDLSSFKDKLQRKYGMSASSSYLFRPKDSPPKK